MAKRDRMFSCRLSEREYNQLMDLLDLCERASNEFVQNKFRNFIKMLHGRLYVNHLGYLRLKQVKGEIDEKDLEELNKAAHQSLYDTLSSIW